MKNAFKFALTACLSTLAIGTAFAQAYSSKPVKLIVPFAPGGFTDVVARILGQKTVGVHGPAICHREQGWRGLDHRD